VQETLSILQQNGDALPESRAEFGSRGEALAAEFLIANGYRVVMSNFKVPIGRNRQEAQVTGEIDIIALDGETLCFIEVKTRRSEEFTPILTAVDLRKQRQITRTAKVYRRIFNVYEVPHRFDVATVLMVPGREPRIELERNFWTEAKFRKRAWHFQMWQDGI
jgi:putative endonuclease